jgi:hypothetical protein
MEYQQEKCLDLFQRIQNALLQAMSPVSLERVRLNSKLHFPYPLGTGNSLTGGKATDPEDYYLPPTSAEVKKT